MEELMRAKLLILSLIGVILSVLTTGCVKRQVDPNEATNFLKDLTSYSTEYVMEFKNDIQIISYEGKQFYDKSKGYRLEVGKDRFFIYKPDKIYVNDVKNNVKYTMDNDFDNGYKLSLVKEYVKLLYTNEEINYSFKDIEGKKYELVELILPGANEDKAKAVMYINLKNYHPEQIIVYDEKDNERIKITYKNFLVSPQMKDELFKVE
jgi:outer membrane lipoprotein-sorting protein